MKLPCEINFVDEQLKRSLADLKGGDDFERMLFDSIVTALHKITENAYCGVQIKKKQIPRIYKANYALSNLWKYDLISGWRLLYTIKTDQIVVMSILLEWLDHTHYERRFGY